MAASPLKISSLVLITSKDRDRPEIALILRLAHILKLEYQTGASGAEVIDIVPKF